MAHIEEYDVAEPARSEDIKDQALAAMGSSAGQGVLELVLRPEWEVPERDDVRVAFRIQQTLHLSVNGGTLSGERVEMSHPEDGTDPVVTALPGTVTVRLAENPDQPATASMTVED